jgi:hypothetical protein
MPDFGDVIDTSLGPAGADALLPSPSMSSALSGMAEQPSAKEALPPSPNMPEDLRGAALRIESRRAQMPRQHALIQGFQSAAGAEPVKTLPPALMAPLDLIEREKNRVESPTSRSPVPSTAPEQTAPFAPEPRRMELPLTDEIEIIANSDAGDSAVMSSVVPSAKRPWPYSRQENFIEPAGAANLAPEFGAMAEPPAESGNDGESQPQPAPAIVPRLSGDLLSSIRVIGMPAHEAADLSSPQIHVRIGQVEVKAERPQLPPRTSRPPVRSRGFQEYFRTRNYLG